MLVPKVWLQESKPKAVIAKSTVKARVDMSAEVAGLGLCPECRKPMEPSVANGHKGVVCHEDRIFLPSADEVSQ